MSNDSGLPVEISRYGNQQLLRTLATADRRGDGRMVAPVLRSAAERGAGRYVHRTRQRISCVMGDARATYLARCRMDRATRSLAADVWLDTF